MTRDSSWWRFDDAAQRLSLTLQIQPNSKKNGIVGLHGDALKVRIAAPAVDNKANAALIGYLSELLDVPRSAILIRRGTTGRHKVVEIAGGPALAARARDLK